MSLAMQARPRPLASGGHSPRPRGSAQGNAESDTRSATCDVLQVTDVIGGPSRTRTLDPLIKSRRTAAREIKHFSCRRHLYRTLQNAVERHVSHQGAVLASTFASFSPQISPQPCSSRGLPFLCEVLDRSMRNVESRDPLGIHHRESLNISQIPEKPSEAG